MCCAGANASGAGVGGANASGAGAGAGGAGPTSEMVGDESGWPLLEGGIGRDAIDAGIGRADGVSVDATTEGLEPRGSGGGAIGAQIECVSLRRDATGTAAGGGALIESRSRASSAMACAKSGGSARAVAASSWPLSASEGSEARAAAAFRPRGALGIDLRMLGRGGPGRGTRGAAGLPCFRSSDPAAAPMIIFLSARSGPSPGRPFRRVRPSGRGPARWRGGGGYRGNSAKISLVRHGWKSGPSAAAGAPEIQRGAHRIRSGATCPTLV